MNDAFQEGHDSVDAAMPSRAQLTEQLRAAARSQIHGADREAEGWTAIYTLADPRDVRCPRYVGQTRSPRRRFAQHVHMARLWLPDQTPWWVGSPQNRRLHTWMRALHKDGGRLPFMWVVEWIEPATDRLAAERAMIIRLVAEGAELLNADARLLGAQLPLL